MIIFLILKRTSSAKNPVLHECNSPNSNECLEKA